MAAALEVPDGGDRYRRLSAAVPPEEVRRTAIELGEVLAHRARSLLGAPGGPRHAVPGSVLCVVVLRGGALLYPGFSVVFADADFCMLGMRRENGAVRTEYVTPIPGNAYAATLYLDCVTATGGTLLAAREAVGGRCAPGRETAVVISGAATATKRLGEAGMDVLGCSLHEGLNGDVVLPDMGALDAGDLFSGAAGRPSAPGGPADGARADGARGDGR
ncbi:uracil phosphoribosyltransferase [Streptomyces sp. NPDC003077]|uniref:uracil phosphoribosyltransferase n=1 Tax=Streptomyces sp. NPDC003077 TaxID=3154443 RepID=UPI0033ABFC81